MYNKYLIIISIFSLILIYENILAEDGLIELTIRDSINRVLVNSFEWKKTKMTEKLYNQLLFEYWREYCPKLGLGFNREEDVVIRGPDTRKTTVSFSFEQLLYDGGKISNAREITGLERKINFFEARDIEMGIKQEVLNIFLRVLGLEKKRDLQAEFLNSMNIQNKLAEEELNLGEITKLDFLEIQTKLEEEKYQLSKIERELKLEKSNYKKILKFEINQEVKLKSNILETHNEIKDIKNIHKLKDIVNISFVQKREFAKIFLEYKKAKTELEQVQKVYIPTVSLVGSYCLEGEYSPRDKSYNIGVVLNFSIGGNTVKTNANNAVVNNERGFNNSLGSNIALLDNISLWGTQYMQKNLKYLEIMNQKEDFKRQLELEIKSIYEGLSDISESYQIQLRKNFLIEERLKLGQLKHQLGELKRLDVVNIELELLKSKLEIINTVVTYITTGLKLETSIGTPLGYLNLYNIEI